MTNQARSLVALFITAETSSAQAENDNQAFSNAMAIAFPFGMVYTDYTNSRKVWVADYAEVKKVAEDSAGRAFGRAIDRMNKYLKSIDAELFVAPASDSKDAKRKADKKTAEQSAVAMALQQAPEKLAASAASGDEVAAKALVERSKLAAKAAKADATELLKDTVAKLKSANPLAIRIGRAAASGDVNAMVFLICDQWPALATAIAAKVTDTKKIRRSGKTD
jgi:hypothetical protein